MGRIIYYDNVKYLENVKGTIYCGTKNRFFLFNLQELISELVKINKTNYLNNVYLYAKVYDENSDSFVGYENVSGAYYLTENEEKTKLHFTIRNSPLLLDIIYDITADEIYK